MKITCTVVVSYRSYPQFSSHSKQQKYSATLSLCHQSKQKETDSDKNAVIILCTSKNPTGMKYKIYNNIEKIFTKFIHQGKATVQFKEPAHDILISEVNPLQLKGFLQGVGLTNVGQGTGKVHFSCIPTKFDRQQRKLAITKRQDYPIKSNFPQSLKHLQVQSCMLKKLDGRMLKLHNLQVLDLSYNCIKELPTSLADIRLKQLILSHNKIMYFPVELSTGILAQTLSVLDLSHNEITYISPYFSLMKRLNVLLLDWNKLTKLPRNLNQLESLKKLSISYNELEFLPYGIRLLEFIDISSNPFNNKDENSLVALQNVPTLLECAATVVVKHKIQFETQDLPITLRDYIVGHCQCYCGGKTFQNVSSCIRLFDLPDFAASVCINGENPINVPLKIYFCSSKCQNRSLLKRNLSI